MATTGCNVRKAPLPGEAGPCRARSCRPGCPSHSPLLATGRLRSQGTRAKVCTFILSWARAREGGRGGRRSLCQGSEMPGHLPSLITPRTINPFQKILLTKVVSGSPPPRPQPGPSPLLPFPRASSSPVASPPPPLPGTLISMATWERFLGGGRHPKSVAVSALAESPSGDSTPGVPLAQVLLPINCLGGGRE